MINSRAGRPLPDQFRALVALTQAGIDSFREAERAAAASYRRHPEWWPAGFGGPEDVARAGEAIWRAEQSVARVARLLLPDGGVTSARSPATLAALPGPPAPGRG
jgi:hypothetical protein